ncbi:non-hydrolyzing UDP-N-acetylglucosamine 2-epimerase [Legionella sp. km772]|uniref:non-hydrolyzing UDP-N-acetylglucosamine 2-epimerase n=1 Tax=Legionella sp. km772 TaxID=2498111 RepID=UPI000F8E1102|nr:UDP-N-acetylglucosamine 2-epimerase (non-hydrolyzing) [Legionella sp. km772]RUR13722.1 UDP-N-acetylglucosamine 2-epimerase (non-hydrolyzing) [Legionella sp. km772]
MSAVEKRLTIGCVVGTRPEVIKMAPIIFQLQQCHWAKVIVINTAQHRSLLDGMLTLFNISPDVDLNSMTENQTLGSLTGNLCIKLEALVQQYPFDALLAIGDTTTVFVASLISFYNRIPFGHIEAGLRTYNIKEPFPEEVNRVLTAPLSEWHFAPTKIEKENLMRENIPASKILITGNSVIDALQWVLKNTPDPGVLLELDNIVIVTAHRRENFGKNMRNICHAIIELSEKLEHINFVFPVHPNPNVQKDILFLLNKRPRIHLLYPLRYDEFTHLMNRSLLILTDSGGIQEEAPALGKPVVVLRNTTERPEIVTAGVGVLVGTDSEQIIKTVYHLLTDKRAYEQMAKGVSPYGDGLASQRIVECLARDLFAKLGSFL